jgi:hypothetical protein
MMAYDTYDTYDTYDPYDPYDPYDAYDAYVASSVLPPNMYHNIRHIYTAYAH